MVDLAGKIAIGSDHAGFAAKEHILRDLREAGYVVHDFGAFSEESADYPDAAHPVALAVRSGEYPVGILLCGSGNGVAIVANKYAGIRAAICWSGEITRLARQHNDANIIVLPARFITPEDALGFVHIFLSTDFEGGRHQRRIDKIDQVH
jgi:ribose 5-phosphate isomerase B